jgi:hypothetical protein
MQDAMHCVSKCVSYDFFGNLQCSQFAAKNYKSLCAARTDIIYDNDF